MVTPPGLSMRRARRIDVYADGMLRVDSMFQDSVRLPDGRLAGTPTVPAKPR